MTAAARCLVCGEHLPDRDRSRGGRKSRYCSEACKAKAYRARKQDDSPAGPDQPPLPGDARHALAGTASGQQALFTMPGTTCRTRPAEAARTLHRLIAELATLATAAGVMKRVTKRRPPETMPLFDAPGAGGE